VTDTQVTTFVQQLDAQGPAVVQRVSTQVGDLACSQDTIENLVDALHSGKTVTITSNVNGQPQSAQFNASGAHLGYGEAYIALALAAQELRNAGVSSCATPDQWQAALIGGPLNTSVTSSTTNSYAAAGGSTQFPGIVTLHSQGQGWGQIAQSTNLQLSQVVNNSSDVSINSQNNTSLNTQNNNTSPSPTGLSSAEMNQPQPQANADHDNDKPKVQKKHWWSREKDSDKQNAEQQQNTNEDRNSSSTHADTSANGASASGASSSSSSTR
jgi:hypothetical protein